MMYLHTISACVDDIVDRLDASSVHSLKSIKKEELSRLHHGWGTAIRNEFGLWQPDNPITKNWHAFPEKRTMKMSGNCEVDCSEDHPDAVSMRIMEGVWTKVNA